MKNFSPYLTFTIEIVLVFADSEIFNAAQITEHPTERESYRRRFDCDIE